MEPIQPTLDTIRDDPEVQAYIRATNRNLAAAGYTEHGFRHVGLVANIARNVLRLLDYPPREQELAAKAASRETELQNQWNEDLRVREEEWNRQAEARVRAAEARLGQELRQKDDLFEVKMRQREQQLVAEFDARQAEQETQTQHFHRRREEESADANQRALRELEAQLRQEMQQKEEAAQGRIKQREQELLTQMNAQTEAHKQAQQQWETEFHLMRRNIEPLNALLKRTERERDEAEDGPERFDQPCLGEPGRADQEPVPAAEDRDQRTLDHLLLADDPPRDHFAGFDQLLAGRLDLRHQVFGVRHLPPLPMPAWTAAIYPVEFNPSGRGDNGAFASQYRQPTLMLQRNTKPPATQA